MTLFRRLAVLVLLVAIPAFLFAQQSGGTQQDNTQQQQQQGTQQQSGNTTQSQSGSGATQAGPGTAQGPVTDTTQTGTSTQAETSQKAAGNTLNSATQTGSFKRFDDLIGTSVTTSDGANVGTIQDAVISAQGNIAYWVLDLSQGGTGSQGAQSQTGMQQQSGTQQSGSQGYQTGTQQSGTQSDQAGMQQQSGTAQQGMQAQAQSQPSVGGNRHLVAVNELKWNGSVATLTIGQNQIGSLPVMQGNTIPSDILGAQSAANQYVLVSDLRNFQFVNAAGQQLGSISGVMLNLQQDKVVYYGLTPAGTLGAGQKVVAVPLTDITSVNVAQKQLMTTLTQAQIGNAQGIDTNNWPAEPPASATGQPSQSSGS